MIKTISIIGVGNLSNVIIKGLRNKNKKIKINLYDVNSKKRIIAKKFSCNFSKSLNDRISQSNLTVIAVKPHHFSDVAKKLQAFIDNKSKIVSLMAGVNIKNIIKQLNMEIAISRVMTNINSECNYASTFIYTNKYYKKNDKVLLANFFNILGSVHHVKSENDIDKITVLSGSGPAYVINFLETMVSAYIKMGFSRNKSEEYARELFYGTIYNLVASKKHHLNIKQSVISKGGTTEQALQIMMKYKFNDIFEKAIEGAFKKAKTMSTKK